LPRTAGEARCFKVGTGIGINIGRGDDVFVALRDLETLTRVNGNEGVEGCSERICQGAVLRGSGDDVLTGGNAGPALKEGDELGGDGGEDRLDGGRRPDAIRGGGGEDRVTGGPSDDLLVLGMPGRDDPDRIIDCGAGQRPRVRGSSKVPPHGVRAHCHRRAALVGQPFSRILRTGCPRRTREIVRQLLDLWNRKG
jgi:hypothetical protein